MLEVFFGGPTFSLLLSYLLKAYILAVSALFLEMISSTGSYLLSLTLLTMFALMVGMLVARLTNWLGLVMGLFSSKIAFSNCKIFFGHNNSTRWGAYLL